MNRKEYNSDPRYAKILEQMDLLGIMDVTTTRQAKNGTIIWKLPIKKYGQLIEIGSFQSGYVRRMNGGYTPYQLNKTEKFDHYYKMYDYSNDNSPKFNGNYRKHECVKRILIPNEVDRLEYLIAFCLKNYYINQANMIENGEFVPRWKYEHELNRGGHYDKVRELQNKIQDLELELQDARDDYQDLSYRNKIGWRYGNEDEISVTINGHRYKVK